MIHNTHNIICSETQKPTLLLIHTKTTGWLDLYTWEAGEVFCFVRFSFQMVTLNIFQEACFCVIWINSKCKLHKCFNQQQIMLVLKLFALLVNAFKNIRLCLFLAKKCLCFDSVMFGTLGCMLVSNFTQICCNLFYL